MDRSIHARLDEAAESAVAELRARGINLSQVIRDALVDCAACERSAEAFDYDTEVWERFLEKHRHDDDVPIIRAWREREDPPA